MANPGPAVTVSLHPQGLTSAQALRLIGQAKGVNIAATGDTPIDRKSTRLNSSHT